MQGRDEIVRAIEGLPRRGRGKRYPGELRQAIIAYAAQRRDAGVALRRVGHELGISWRTLSRWGSERRAAFERVELEPDETQSVRVGGYVVYGPRETRVHGLGLPEIAELFRRLG